MKILNKHLEVKELLKTNNIVDTAKLSDTSVGFVHKVKGMNDIKITKVSKAVIWAAGWGSRLSPVTKHIPKPLVTVRGISMLETLLISLKKSGINDISIVLGRQAKSFDDIVKKYGLKIIMNEKWQKHNNISSYFASIPVQKSATYLLDADLIVSEDFRFPREIVNSFMYTSECDDIHDLSIKKSGSWITGYINGTKSPKKESGEQYKGMFCLKKEDIIKLNNEVKSVYDLNAEYNDDYWFDSLFKLAKEKSIFVETKVIPFADVIEVDLIEDLIEYDPIDYPSRKFIEEKYND